MLSCLGSRQLLYCTASEFLAVVMKSQVGCGTGNTVFPLLAEYPDIFVHACDFSARAVSLVKVCHGLSNFVHPNFDGVTKVVHLYHSMFFLVPKFRQMATKFWEESMYWRNLDPKINFFRQNFIQLTHFHPFQ